MKKTIIKNSSRKWLIVAAFILVLATGWMLAAELLPIKLNPPDLKRGLPLMEALAVRASAREYSEKELSLQDLSDLFWAADGMSRPAENKSTAPSAMNSHDIRIYVFMKAGAFLYDAARHRLVPVLGGDYRTQLAMARPPRPVTPPPSTPVVVDVPPAVTVPPAVPQPGVPAVVDVPPAVTAQPAGVTPPVPPAGATVPPGPGVIPPPPANPPLQIILVSDGDRFTRGDPARKLEWGALDAGIVSQNISLFCAATGLKTCPKALIDKAKIKALLHLKDTQTVFLNHPVGYAK